MISRLDECLKSWYIVQRFVLQCTITCFVPLHFIFLIGQWNYFLDALCRYLQCCNNAVYLIWECKINSVHLIILNVYSIKWNNMWVCRFLFKNFIWSYVDVYLLDEHSVSVTLNNFWTEMFYVFLLCLLVSSFSRKNVVCVNNASLKGLVFWKR